MGNKVDEFLATGVRSCKTPNMYILLYALLVVLSFFRQVFVHVVILVCSTVVILVCSTGVLLVCSTVVLLARNTVVVLLEL